MSTTIPENIKKTSVATFIAIQALLTSGELTQESFDKIEFTLRKAVGATKQAGEKVISFLYDDDNEVIARFCNVTAKWFTIDRFLAKSGRVKEMDLLMKKEYTRVGKIKKDLEQKWVELMDAEGSDKLDLLNAYEELKSSAEPQLPTDEEIGSVEGGFDSVEDIAIELDVAVKTQKSED